MADSRRAARDRRRSPGCETYLFGHIADGGVHVNVLADPTDHEIDQAIMRLTAEHWRFDLGRARDRPGQGLRLDLMRSGDGTRRDEGDSEGARPRPNPEPWRAVPGGGVTMVRIVVHPDNTRGRERRSRRASTSTGCSRMTRTGVRSALADGAPVLVTAKWDAAFLQPTLEWVQGLGAGYEQFPIDTIRGAGVVFTNATGTHPCVAEHTFGLLLALTRNIAPAIRDGMSRTWSPIPPMVDLAGKDDGHRRSGHSSARRSPAGGGWDIR
jgi:hypothetical protein